MISIGRFGYFSIGMIIVIVSPSSVIGSIWVLDTNSSRSFCDRFGGRNNIGNLWNMVMIPIGDFRD